MAYMNRKALMQSLKQDFVFQKMLRHLEANFKCHTIILYGSRARGIGITDSSDYDILAIRETGENIREADEFEGKFLDAWIYSESILNEADTSLTRVKDGLIVKQTKSFGTKLLKKVKEIFRAGPSPIPYCDLATIY
jgi:predicted nucleotidyltransferase